eukprot:8146660-Pyramimonas_sp.AAC.1
MANGRPGNTRSYTLKCILTSLAPFTHRVCFAQHQRERSSAKVGLMVDQQPILLGKNRPRTVVSRIDWLARESTPAVARRLARSENRLPQSRVDWLAGASSRARGSPGGRPRGCVTSMPSTRLHQRRPCRPVGASRSCWRRARSRSSRSSCWAPAGTPC